jgi:hypothetical protein
MLMRRTKKDVKRPYKVFYQSGGNTHWHRESQSIHMTIRGQPEKETTLWGLMQFAAQCSRKYCISASYCTSLVSLLVGKTVLCTTFSSLKTIKITSNVFHYMFRPKMAIITCLKIQFLQGDCCLSIIIGIYLVITPCVCVGGPLLLCHWCVCDSPATQQQVSSICTQSCFKKKGFKEIKFRFT